MGYTYSCILPGCVLRDIQLYPPWVCIRGYRVVSSLGVLGDIELYPPWVCVMGYTEVSSLGVYWGIYILWYPPWVCIGGYTVVSSLGVCYGIYSCIIPGCVLGDIQLYPPWVFIRGYPNRTHLPHTNTSHCRLVGEVGWTR